MNIMLALAEQPREIFVVLSKFLDLLCPLRVRHRELQEKYYDLIMSVERKFPDETRHETALRYIRYAELPTHPILSSASSDPASLPHLDASGPSEAVKNLTK